MRLTGKTHEDPVLRYGVSPGVATGLLERVGQVVCRLDFVAVLLRDDPLLMGEHRALRRDAEEVRGLADDSPGRRTEPAPHPKCGGLALDPRGDKRRSDQRRVS